MCVWRARTCQHSMPAWSSQSMNLKASPPSSPMPCGPGREVGCRMTPARLPLCQSGMLEFSLYAAPSCCPTLLAFDGAAAAALASARTTGGRLLQVLLGCRRSSGTLRCCRCDCCWRADDGGTWPTKRLCCCWCCRAGRATLLQPQLVRCRHSCCMVAAV